MTKKILLTFITLFVCKYVSADVVEQKSLLSKSPQLVDYKNSSENPKRYDENGRKIRFRTVLDTNVACPRYEHWRTGLCEQEKGNTLSLKLKKTVDAGLVIACANEGSSFNTTAYEQNGKKYGPYQSSSISVMTLPKITPVTGIDFVSEKLKNKLNNRFIMLKSARQQLKAENMNFGLNGLFFFSENWVNVAPEANVAVSNVAVKKAAEKNTVLASGLNDMKTERIWRGKGQGVESILSWSKPVDIAAVGFYFSWNSYGDMPKEITLYGKKENQDDWQKIESFNQFNNHVHTGRKLYVLTVPEQKLKELKISYKARKEYVGVTELFVFSPAGKKNEQKKDLAQQDIITFNADVPESGNVSLVINDKTGKRVRNLIANMPVKVKEESSFFGLLSSVDPSLFKWDGLDDNGNVVSPGEYVYKGIVHDSIKAIYQQSIYNAGNVPWTSADLKGGWLSDHCTPSSMLVLNDSIWVGSPMAEAGSTIMQLNLKGDKQWGIRWLDLAGAEFLAKDKKNLYVASEGGWRKHKLSVIKLDPVTKEFKRLLDLKVKSNAHFEKGEAVTGFAVKDNVAYLSFPSESQIKLYSLVDGALKKTLTVPTPGAIFAKDDLIYFISDNTVKAAKGDFTEAKTIIGENLIKPDNFCIDNNGWFYVCDQGTNQVKIFDNKGKLLKCIGKPGGRKVGIYDPMVFDKPSAVTVTNNGDIWVAENSKLPKRISVWNKDGKLLKEFIGNGEYACGGSLDPDESTRYFSEGMEFKLDLDKHKSSLKSVYLQNKKTDFLNSTPERAIRVRGNLFLVQDKYWNRPFFWIGMMDDKTHVLKPVAAVGRYEKVAKYFGKNHKQVPNGKEKEFTFLWNDDNRNGIVDWEEFGVRKGGFAALLWGCHIGDDLHLYWYDEGDNEFKELAPIEWHENIPIYSFKNIKGLNTGAKSRWDNISFHRIDKKHLLLNSKTDYRCIDPVSGQVYWTYPNPFPCNTHDSPLPKSGDIQHTLQVEGVVNVNDDIGAVFSLNSNKGLRHLFTTDGIYIAPVFRDMRLAPTMSFVNNVKPGDDLTNYSLEDEAFNGTFQQDSDGNIYMVCGKHHHSVFRIDGLDSIKRFEGSFYVSADQVKRASENLLRLKEREKLQKIAQPIVLRKVVDKRKFFNTTNPASVIEQNGKQLCKAAFGIDKNNFYFSAKINDDTPFVNKGKDVRMMFKTGDSFNIEFGARRNSLKNQKPIPGDVRLLIALHKGKATCVAYFYNVPGTVNPVSFTSPWNETKVDQVKVLENARINVRKQDRSYSITGVIPRKDIGLDYDFKTLYGDFGVIFSDANGSRNSYTIFYASPAKGVTTDVPSEIRLLPKYWRKIKLSL